MKNKTTKARGIPRAGGDVGSTKSRSIRATLNDRATRADRNELQTSSKIGVESGSQKEDSLRYKTDIAPPSTPVPGAFGKTGTPSEIEEEIIHPEEDAESGRRDFLAERRRQNRRAKK